MPLTLETRATTIRIIGRRLLSASIFERENGRLKIFARLRRVGDLMLHTSSYRAIRRRLADPAFAGILARQPQLPIKFLHPSYLVQTMSTRERATAILHHYGFLRRSLDPASLAKMLERGVLVWDQENMEHGGERHAVDLVFSHPTDNEGELTLEYRFRGRLIYMMSFTFVAGPVVGARDATTILITRLQGAKGCYEETREAMKSVRGVAPPALLLAACIGLAERLGIATLAGVTATAQVCFEEDRRAQFLAVYDGFLGDVGGLRTERDYLAIALPLQETPLSEIKANRSRTRAQRAIKAEIGSRAFDAITPFMASPDRVVLATGE